LNGTVLSTTGGAGSYFIEYAPLPDVWGSQFAKRTPARTIDFVADRLYPVSEPVDELTAGWTNYYRVCAEDGENPGDPFCSRVQSVRTIGDSVVGGGVTATLLDDLEATVSFELGGGPSGENVFGFAVERDFVGRGAVGAPKCLLVHGNRAVIGLEWTPIPGTGTFSDYVVVEDGGPAGQDKWGRVSSSGPPTDCAGVSGDVSLAGHGRSTIVVTDAEPPPT
jgi:hypothetical protein